jgi:hypothetical protein
MKIGYQNLEHIDTIKEPPAYVIDGERNLPVAFC